MALENLNNYKADVISRNNIYGDISKNLQDLDLNDKDAVTNWFNKLNTARGNFLLKNEEYENFFSAYEDKQENLKNIAISDRYNTFLQAMAKHSELPNTDFGMDDVARYSGDFYEQTGSADLEKRIFNVGKSLVESIQARNQAFNENRDNNLSGERDKVITAIGSPLSEANETINKFLKSDVIDLTDHTDLGIVATETKNINNYLVSKSEGRTQHFAIGDLHGDIIMALSILNHKYNTGGEKGYLTEGSVVKALEDISDPKHRQTVNSVIESLKEDTGANSNNISGSAPEMVIGSLILNYEKVLNQIYNRGPDLFDYGWEIGSDGMRTGNKIWGEDNYIKDMSQSTNQNDNYRNNMYLNSRYKR